MQNILYSIHFETLGCKLNQIESESAAHFFSEAGYLSTMYPVLARQEKNLDTLLCIVNTCTVTSKAEQKGRHVIRLLLEKYPSAAILVTGCYAQLDAKILSDIDTRVAVLGGQSKGELVALPNQMNLWYKNKELEYGDGLALSSKLRLLFAGTAEIAFGQLTNVKKRTNTKKDSLPTYIKATPLATSHINETFALSTDTFLTHSRSSIKVQDGCNNHCAYCRICFARGASVSLDAQIVLKRIQQLETAGHHEVVITGVNLTQYKVAIPEGATPSSKNRDYFDFADLLQFLLNNTQSIKFRISSLYPERVDDELCKSLADKRVQPHFHLSVQSGSDSILKAMHRPYKAQQIIDAVEKLRAIKKHPFIACDIIAGFPNESEADFEETISMSKKCNFSWIHAFPFSARPGTEAYTMNNQIPKQIAKKRVQKLTELAKEQKQKYVQLCIGNEYSAIVEKREGRDLRVVTENFLHLLVQIPQIADKTYSPKQLGGKSVIIKVLDKIDKSMYNKEIDGYCVFKSI
jgi:threonylcarbamoyladenosine tRNA methylthiotransferase MtaB